MLPEIHIFGLTLHTFGMMMAAAFIVAAWIVGKRLKELGLPEGWAQEGTLAAAVGGIVGAKFWWVVQEHDSERGLAAEVFSGTGLVWYGGLIGGVIAGLAWARWRGALRLSVLDAAAPAMAAGYAVGRLGCQLAGDGDYGVPSDLPWAMAYPNGTVPTLEQVHPTPIYEFIAMGLVALLLWRLRDRLTGGALFALYLVLAGAERFAIEFIRINDDVLGVFSSAQLFSVVMILAGSAWLLPKRSAEPPVAALAQRN